MGDLLVLKYQRKAKSLDGDAIVVAVVLKQGRGERLTVELESSNQNSNVSVRDVLITQLLAPVLSLEVGSCLRVVPM